MPHMPGVIDVIDVNWLKHESPGSKPDFLGEIKVFLLENLKVELNIGFSKILQQIGKGETGW